MADLSPRQNIATCAARLCLTAKNRRLLYFTSDLNPALDYCAGVCLRRILLRNSRGVRVFTFVRFV